MSKQNQDGLTIKKEENFSEWYQQLILKSDLADYSSVSGCMILKPKSYSIWERVKEIIDAEFKKIGIQNAYFPLFIPEKLLAQESEHVEGFTPEVAWVTHAGNTKLSEKLAVRPTSEAIMYESYSKWIRSWKDLPLRMNQWNNVVRWEFKHPTPFLRTREFLWNEGHNAYANQEDLEKDKEKIIKIYSSFLKEYMALPSIFGRKTDKEKFAGANATYSLELMLPNGKAIQGPDYHDDGQNFAKAYGIKYTDKEENNKYCFQSTYAITTRVLGIMFAVHSDNKGLVLPPKMAENKVVIIPIIFDKTKNKVLTEAKKIEKQLSKFNAFIDERTDVTPGRKFNEWELKGIPLRIEIGPKDLEKKQVIIAKRNDGKKIPVKIKDIKKENEKLLEQMQEEMYSSAEKFLKNNIVKAETIKELIQFIKNGKMVLSPMCRNPKCEEIIKEKTEGAKTTNIPENQTPIKGKKCIECGNQADYLVYIAKSY